MRNEQLEKILPVIQAYVAGKDIQYKQHAHHEWITFNNVKHDQINFEYVGEWRIKPDIREFWLNIYHDKDDKFDCACSARDHRMIDTHAYKDRKACVKVVYEVGEGL